MKSLDVPALEPSQFIAMEDGGNDIELCYMTTNDHMSKKKIVCKLFIGVQSYALEISLFLCGYFASFLFVS